MSSPRPKHTRSGRSTLPIVDAGTGEITQAQIFVAIITRINQRTATVDWEGNAGRRVPFAMLRHVMDI